MISEVTNSTSNNLENKHLMNISSLDKLLIDENYKENIIERSSFRNFPTGEVVSKKTVIQILGKLENIKRQILIDDNILKIGF
ncbi:hypothetical protein M6C27_002423, partial [Staphylococcus pseudintermedius]|nr:hypothetical protein [Staphylococcus pseudintermedius]